MASATGRIDLVRHAQDESARAAPAYHPRPESPLTEYGLQQARTTGAKLAADYAGIVYSPILRAEQTARLFSEVSGIPIFAKVPTLSEWRPPSCVYGKTPDEYDDDYRAWRYARAENPTLSYQDGESLLDLHVRAALAVAELRSLAADNGPLLAVSHKVLLGVITAQGVAPAEAFHRATSEPWQHCEVRTLADHNGGEA